MPRAQSLLTRNAPYSTSSVVTDLDDAAPQNYSLSNGTYARPRHSQGQTWNNTNRSFFPDQGLSPSTHGPFTMNPVDAVYTQAMMSGYESAAPLNTSTDLFIPLGVAQIGRHQVFNEQDIVQDPVLALDMNDYNACSSQVNIPYSGLTTWNHGYPSPPVENTRNPGTMDDTDCTMPNSGMTTGRWSRHGVPIMHDIDMSQEILPYDVMESDVFSRHR